MTCLEVTVFLSERRGAYLRIIAIFAYDVTILLASQKMALGAKTHTQASLSCNFNFDFKQTDMIFVQKKVLQCNEQPDTKSDNVHHL